MEKTPQIGLPQAIASHGLELEAAISEAAYCALLQLGDGVYDLEWANKYVAVPIEELKQAA